MFHRNAWNKVKLFALFVCTVCMVLSLSHSSSLAAATFHHSSHEIYLKHLKKIESPTHTTTSFESVQFLKEVEGSENDTDSDTELDHFFLYSYFKVKATQLTSIPKLFYLVDQPYFVKTHIALFLLFHSWKSYLA